MASKLTLKHIDLSVKLATHLLSHSVAAGITTLVSLCVFPESAWPTTMFLEKIDKFVNVFNSSLFTCSKQLGHQNRVSLIY